MPDDIKTLGRIGFDVPLASHVSIVASGLHQAGPQLSGFTQGFCILGNFLSPPHTATGQQHIAAGHTNSPAPRAHVVGMRKGHTAPSQPVQVGRIDIRLSQVAERFVTEIVREQEQDIRLVRSLQPRAYETQNEECQPYSHSIDPKKVSAGRVNYSNGSVQVRLTNWRTLFVRQDLTERLNDKNKSVPANKLVLASP